MRTQTLVQPSADVVTVVSLRAGDVFKRLIDQGANYGETRYRATFGIVESVDSNGEDVMVSVLEMEEEWSGAPVLRHRVYGTDAEVKIFAATPSEIAVKFNEYEAALTRKLSEAARAQEAAVIELTRFNSVVARHRKGELTAAEVAADG